MKPEGKFGNYLIFNYYNVGIVSILLTSEERTPGVYVKQEKLCLPILPLWTRQKVCPNMPSGE